MKSKPGKTPPPGCTVTFKRPKAAFGRCCTIEPARRGGLIERVVLPQNPQEEQELFDLGKKSAWDFYAKVYGSKSETALRVQGLSWEEMGVYDSQEEMRTILDHLRRKRPQ